MILLDTNVLSALMQRQPDPAVMAWLNEQPAERIWITSITVFEARQAGLWAIAKKSFGGAPHYDEGCLTVESTDELKMALLKLAHLPQPKAANFEKLRPTSIGNTLSSLYSSLLFA